MKILFCSYGGGHVTAVLPIIAEMLERGHECVYLALTTAGVVAERAGVEHVRPIDFVDSSDPRIRLWGEKLADRHHTEGKGISLEESIAYLGVSFRDLAADVGECEAWRRYEKQGLNAFCPVYFMREVLASEKPDLVVATSSPRMEKAILRAAYQMRIASLCMVELFGLMEEVWLSRPDNGHFVAVSRPDVVNRLVAAGRIRSDIYLTGSPMFDQLADLTLPEAGKRWRLEHGISEREPLIFWAEQPEPLEPELPRSVRGYLAKICRKNGWRLVIRLHPSSTDASSEVIPDGCLQSHAHEPLTHVIHACDVGITLTSTVGWEVLLSDKPLLVIRISPYRDMVTYGEGDGALAIESLEETQTGIELLLSDGPDAKKLADLRRNLPRPGQATRNIRNLIENEVAHWREIERHADGQGEVRE